MDVTQKVEINKQKANEETNSVPQLGALEEDDEFEEFEVDGECERVGVVGVSVGVDEIIRTHANTAAHT